MSDLSDERRDELIGELEVDLQCIVELDGLITHLKQRRAFWAKCAVRECHNLGIDVSRYPYVERALKEEPKQP